MNKNFYAETNDDDKKDLKKLINMEKVIFKEAGVEQVGYVPNEKLLSKYDACNLIPWEVFAEENNLDPKKTDYIEVDGVLLMDEDFDEKGNVKVLKDGYIEVRPVDSDEYFVTDELWVPTIEFNKNQWYTPYGNALTKIQGKPKNYIIDGEEKIYLYLSTTPQSFVNTEENVLEDDEMEL